MKKVGIVSLGDMGTGMAKNLLKNGFELSGYDLRAERLAELASMGGKPAADSPPRPLEYLREAGNR